MKLYAFIGIVHLLYIYTMALSFRLRNVEPFVNIRTSENDQYIGFQAGVTTYTPTDDGTDETYQTTYVEQGMRSDHLNDTIDELCGRTASVRLASQATDDLVYIKVKETPTPLVAVLQSA